MKTYTYTGETPAEALKKARDEYGDEAMIIQTKEIRKKTLNQPGLFELVIGVADDMPKLAKEDSSDLLPDNSIQKRLEKIAEKEIAEKKKQKSLNQILDNDVTIQLSDTVREISKIAGYPTSMPESPKPKKQPKEPISTIEQINNARLAKEEAQAESRDSKEESKAESNLRVLSENLDSKSFKEVQNELLKLNDKIKLIQNTLWEEKGPKYLGLQVPLEFAEFNGISNSSGMDKNHLEEIMRLSLEFMPLKMREQSQMVKRYFREVLRKMIYCRQENDTGKKIIMLVGPTGVGKTTTLAKLAARYSQLLAQKKKVGIITLDDYRIGAMEQLAWYARKMRISIDSVSESDDFLNKIDSLSYCDYILVDTAGHSQHDKQKINELKKFINTGDYKIDVTLVLSATTKFEDLKDSFKAFGELDIDTFIFSKLDEARGLGNIFSLVYETKKPISYLSIGQEVPSDIIVANNNYLADCLMNGFFYPNKDKQ